MGIGEFYSNALWNRKEKYWRDTIDGRLPSTCKVANFFFATFFFLAKKKVGRSPFSKG